MFEKIKGELNLPQGLTAPDHVLSMSSMYKVKMTN